MSMVTDHHDYDRASRLIFNMTLQDFIWLAKGDSNELAWAVIEREVVRHKQEALA